MEFNGPDHDSTSANADAWEVNEMAAELLANREAQPFGYVYTSKDGVAVNFGYELPFMPEKWKVTPVYTAPPAPAVPPEASPGDIPPEHNINTYSGITWAAAWNACRAAMLAQPVSSGYKLNSPEIPDGWKLMPLEMTDEIGEAIAMEARCCGGIALCIYEAALAAAPEGGN